MNTHFNRKTVCKPLLENINLEEYKQKILNRELINITNILYQDATNQIKTSPNQAKTSPDQGNNNHKYECSFCNKKYLHNQSLYKHVKICKEKKKEDDVKDSMIELVDLLNNKLEEQGNMLINIQKELTKKDKQIDELIKKAGININANTMNVDANINLLGYKETDRSHLTDNDILKCLKHSNFCIPHLIEKIHFDVNKPENHNVYISNLKNKYVMIYDGNKWECKDRENQIIDLIDDNESIIEYKLEEWLENGNKYPKMMKQFSRYVEKKDNDIVINKIKDEIKLLLYNNRTVVNKELILENNVI